MKEKIERETETGKWKQKDEKTRRRTDRKK